VAVKGERDLFGTTWTRTAKENPWDGQVIAAVLTLMIGLMVFFPGRGNSGLDTVAVKGRVTYEGEVLVGGSVSFYPVSRGSGRPSKGSINPDGTYVVKTLLGTSGIVPGEYKIGLVLLELPMGGATPE